VRFGEDVHARGSGNGTSVEVMLLGANSASDSRCNCGWRDASGLRKKSAVRERQVSGEWRSLEETSRVWWVRDSWPVGWVPRGGRWSGSHR
jgi:hypothetical protein